MYFLTMTLLVLIGAAAYIQLLFRDGDTARQPRRFFVLLSFLMFCLMCPLLVSGIFVRQRGPEFSFASGEFEMVQMLHLVAAFTYALLANFEKTPLNWRVLGGFALFAVILGCWRAYDLYPGRA